MSADPLADFKRVFANPRTSQYESVLQHRVTKEPITDEAYAKLRQLDVADACLAREQSFNGALKLALENPLKLDHLSIRCVEASLALWLEARKAVAELERAAEVTT